MFGALLSVLTRLCIPRHPEDYLRAKASTETRGCWSLRNIEDATYMMPILVLDTNSDRASQSFWAVVRFHSRNAEVIELASYDPEVTDH